MDRLHPESLATLRALVQLHGRARIIEAVREIDPSPYRHRPTEPRIHAPADKGAAWATPTQPNLGAALCQAGRASRTEHEQRIVNDVDAVTCRRCRWLLLLQQEPRPR